MKLGFKSTVFVFGAFLCTTWLYALILIPFAVNSEFFVSFLSNVIGAKTETRVVIDGFKYKLYPTFKMQIELDKILLIADDKMANIEGLSATIRPFRFSKSAFIADKVYFQKTNLRNIEKKEKKSSKKTGFNNLPYIRVKDAVVNFGSLDKVTSTAKFFDFTIEDDVLSFDLNLTSRFMSKSFKINKSDKIYLLKDGLYTDDLAINFKNSYAKIQGKFFDTNGLENFNIVGKRLPVRDIEENLLFFAKQTGAKKNFVENFKDINGRLDLNLCVTEGGIYGEAVVSKLQATTVLLDVPLVIDKLVFDFKGRNISAATMAFLGGERVDLNFFLSNMKTPDMAIAGSVKGRLTNNFAKKYIENLQIIGTPLLSVDYLAKDGEVKVNYKALVPKGSDIVYYGAKLGNVDKKRTFQAVTKKVGDTITLSEYKYTLGTLKFSKELIKGDGLFNKKDGKYVLEKLTGKTTNNSPVALLGFLENRLVGGFFNGDLEYDFLKQKLIGSFVLENTVFNDFKIIKSSITGNDKTINIMADGTFMGEEFKCLIDLKNSINSHLYFDKLDLYLKKYTYKKHSAPYGKTKFDMDKTVLYPKVSIKDLKLKLDEFQKDRIIVQNLLLIGAVKENLLEFTTPDIIFANGKISSTGKFDFNNRKFSIDLNAKDVDSNLVAFQFFNLKDQVKGKMFANFHFAGKARPELANGSVSFRIDEGILTKIGNTEFLVRQSRTKEPHRIVISDIVKFDKDLQLNPKSNITGSFDVQNENIKNAKIFMQNDALSIYIEGDFDKNTEFAKLNLWGKYNSEIEKKITIFHMPLSWFTKIVFKAKEKNAVYMEKIKKIPPIKNVYGEERYFNIDAKGNINDSSSLNLNFRSVEIN